MTFLAFRAGRGFRAGDGTTADRRRALCNDEPGRNSAALTRLRSITRRWTDVPVGSSTNDFAMRTGALTSSTMRETPVPEQAIAKIVNRPTPGCQTRFQTPPNRWQVDDHTVRIGKCERLKRGPLAQVDHKTGLARVGTDPCRRHNRLRGRMDRQQKAEYECAPESLGSPNPKPHIEDFLRPEPDIGAIRIMFQQCSAIRDEIIIKLSKSNHMVILEVRTAADGLPRMSAGRVGSEPATHTNPS